MTTPNTDAAKASRYVGQGWVLLSGFQKAHYFRYRGEPNSEGLYKAVSLCGVRIKGTPHSLSDGFGRYDSDCATCINRMMANKSLIAELDEHFGE